MERLTESRTGAVFSMLTAAEVRDVGRAALDAGRPRFTFSGVPVETDGSQFGLDWEWGDTVGVDAFGFSLKPIARKIIIIVDEKGNERIDSTLEFEG